MNDKETYRTVLRLNKIKYKDFKDNGSNLRFEALEIDGLKFQAGWHTFLNRNYLMVVPEHDHRIPLGMRLDPTPEQLNTDEFFDHLVVPDDET